MMNVPFFAAFAALCVAGLLAGCASSTTSGGAAESAVATLSSAPASQEVPPSPEAPASSAPEEGASGEPVPLEETPSAESTDLPIIESGTWIVGEEISPGYYRVPGYYARLDKDGEVIDNDGVYQDSELTLAVVKSSDDMVEISGQALLIEYLPSVDPIAQGLRAGTYLVGKDIAPSRYRIEDPSYAYGARLDKDLDVIDNEGNAGNVVITIKPSDFAFTYSGDIAPL